LTLRELNRTTLLRQLLLRRERVPVVRAVERLAALQAQWAPSPYIALWSRLEDFDRGSLERALLRGRIVKALLMRATMHAVSARDYPFFDAAVRDARTAGRVRGMRPPARDLVDKVVARARERPITRAEIFRMLGYNARTTESDELRTYSWVVALGRLEQTPEAALYGFRGSPVYRPVDHELPPFDLAVARLIRRYLAAFGPAARADISQWSGVSTRDLAPSLETLRLRTFRDERGRELLDLPRAPLESPGVHAPPRILPRWEELLVAYKDRTRVLPDEYRKAVSRTSVGFQTFLVGGFVTGTWREERGRVVLEPFERLPPRARRELDDEAGRLEAWLR
jgi:hypothetical protein